MNTTVLKTAPMSEREMCERLAHEGRTRCKNTLASVVLVDGSKWVLDHRYGHWACTRGPDSTGTFKLLAGAL